MAAGHQTGVLPGEEPPRESSPYVELDRAMWSRLASETDLEHSRLTQEEVSRLRGIGDALDLQEIRDVYLPLSRLLSLRVSSASTLHRQQEAFLHREVPPRTPFVIGLAGSVGPYPRGRPGKRAGTSTCRSTRPVTSAQNAAPMPRTVTPEAATTRQAAAGSRSCFQTAR